MAPFAPVTKPVDASRFIAAITPTSDAAGNPVIWPLFADNSFTPARLIIELPDRALRDLGKVDIALVDSQVTVVKPVKTQASSNETAITTATTTTVVAAPSAGNHLRIHRIHASNSSATATWVYWRDGTGGASRYPAYLPTNGIVSLALDGGWNLTTATLLALKTSAAGNVEWHVDYETVAD